MAAENGNSNTYEEARKQRLDENKKRFQDLGILDISKSLSKLSTPEKKQRLLKPKAANTEIVEPRRSSRARTTVTSYADELHTDLPPMRKKARGNSSWTSYISRPLDEVKLADYGDRLRTLKAAEKFQTSLQSGNPSFVKSMVRSHVYSCFWLGLPTQFCKDHLPKKDVDMVLEDENGSTCDARFLGSRTGLSGGWRGFALDHKLDDGDAVVFELVEPNKFKLYTFKVSSPESSETQVDVAEENGSAKTTNASEDQNEFKSPSSKKKNSKKAKASKVLNVETSKPQSEVIADDMNSGEKNGVIEENGEKNESEAVKTVVESEAVKTEVESIKENGKRKKHPVRPRKKPAPRLFRRRV
ncbi:putative B3 domain-containing protein At5g58280 [Euphorbia lathyris]|uniref:putative B3 domain-containing protein At5g58280 n=1 Tax=Euphorbia lathyris TaxID=212925 RepID=UPI0033135588